MRWYKQLYIGNKAKEKSKKIISNIKKNKIQIDIFVLTLAINGKDLIDIYPSNVLRQSYYKNQDLLVVGIAKGHDEAIKIVESIVIEVYNATGKYEIRDYILQGDNACDVNDIGE